MKFEKGRTYETRFASNADSSLWGTVVKRTPKTVTFDVAHFGQKTCRVRVLDGVETVLPLGRYSMAPSFRADRPSATV